MGWFSNMFGGKKEPEPGGGAAPAAPKLSASGEKRVCPSCNRALLPGSPCPFCNPQHFGEELPEGTISSSYKPQQGVTGMGGVIVANQLAQQHGAKGFLHVYQGANKGASVLLGNKVVTIGRKVEENMLALNDGGVSSKHCEVRPQGSGFLLVDAGSKNGTFVNDKRVKEHMLVNGDLIAFGGTRIYVGIL
jgi:hypothetical protein